MPESMQDFLTGALHGKLEYVGPLVALEELSAEDAMRRPHDDLATIYEQLAHIIFWLENSLALLRGENPPYPESASESWPSQPTPDQAATEWPTLLERFQNGLKVAEEITRSEDVDALLKADARRTVGQEIFVIAQHNSYHFGQIVSLRRMMGLWPPPSGGATW
ncbi:MAG TPA: DinB family protein [Acidobacteriota bacterium]|nr:DinB family protein [Acidobacteriota bacterium]